MFSGQSPVVGGQCLLIPDPRISELRRCAGDGVSDQALALLANHEVVL